MKKKKWVKQWKKLNEDANYKSHWNISVICFQWKMMSDLNMFNGKMSDGFTLAIQLRKWLKYFTNYFLMFFYFNYFM